MQCRHCSEKIEYLFADLGVAPPSNSYLDFNDLKKPEVYYPLQVYVCNKCWLVQTRDFNDPSVYFSDEYAYFSSTSSLWLEHSKNYANKIINDLKLDQKSMVIEIACNDGYLLNFFKQNRIPCLGIEPTKSTASAAMSKGINVIQEFFTDEFSKKLCEENAYADLVVANNVLAHVPDINNFIKGIKRILKPNGVFTAEFPHLINLIKYNQFDTIYHEHFSYLSITALMRILKKFELRIWKIEKLNTHGGSLRTYVVSSNDKRKTESTYSQILNQEKQFGLDCIETYSDFSNKVNKIKIDLLTYLLNKKSKSETVVGYGAAAKANTLLNFCGIKSDLISVICDKSPAKQGKFLPGSRIPIKDPEVLNHLKPSSVIIFPWNIENEIVSELSYLKNGGCTFVTCIPELRLF